MAEPFKSAVKKGVGMLKKKRASKKVIEKMGTVVDISVGKTKV